PAAIDVYLPMDRQARLPTLAPGSPGHRTSTAIGSLPCPALWHARTLSRYPPPMLTLDYANCLSERVGDHGLDPARLAPGGEAAAAIATLSRRLESTKGT